MGASRFTICRVDRPFTRAKMAGSGAGTSESEALDVSPQELAFKVTPDNYSTKQLRLSNRSKQTMAFKIKTTNPKQYFVRPNQGLIKQGDRVIIHVMMGKMAEVPKEKCKDRFLVQSHPFDGPADQAEKFEWKTHFTSEKFPPSTFKPSEVKLKCSYIQPKDEDDGAERPKAPTPQGSQEATKQDSELRQRPKSGDTPKAEPPAKQRATVGSMSGSSPAKIQPVTAPSEAAGPAYTMYLIIAVLFFFIGRYTVHIDLAPLGLN